MTDRLSDAQLAELEALLAKATPGPWHVQRYDEDDGSITYEIWNDDVERVLRINDDGGNPRAKIDGDAIASAVNALPALLAEAKQARADVAAIRAAAFEEAAAICELTNGALLLMAGEMTADTLRAVQAVLKSRASAIRALAPLPAPPADGEAK